MERMSKFGTAPMTSQLTGDYITESARATYNSFIERHTKKLTDIEEKETIRLVRLKYAELNGKLMLKRS